MMDHAEARARLAELALEPDRLDRLAGVAAGASAASGDADVADHVATCPECSREVDAWQRTVRLLDAARAGVEGSSRSTLREIARTDLGSTPIDIPSGLRDRTIAAVHSEPSAGRTAAPSTAVPSVVPFGRVRRTLPGWLAAAAAVAILVVGAGFLVNQSRQLDAAQAEAEELAAVLSQLDGILQDQAHSTAVLMSSTGAAAGSASWGPSSGGIVVLTSALEAPPSGLVYRCWLEADGARTAIGVMSFSGSTAYWAGSLAGWGGGVSRGGRLGVSLEPAAGGVEGEPILVAAF
jgi:Anti-sigma-K factor rskA